MKKKNVSFYNFYFYVPHLAFFIISLLILITFELIWTGSGSQKQKKKFRVNVNSGTLKESFRNKEMICESAQSLPS